MGSADGEERLGGCRDEDRILVSVRVRPLNEKEACRSEVVDWECINDTTIIYKNHLSPERSMFPTSYSFDRVFGFDCSTRKVYEQGAKAVVFSAVNGINSSVFAYGQTSSGKTYTMSGITEYTMEEIFDYIQKHKERDFHLKFSAMEIYNESVRDLLTADNSPLRLLDDPERGTVVEKLTEETLRDRNHFKELLAVCEAQRQIGETFLNEASSRSHQILRVMIESSTREFLGKNNSSSLAATLNFVDLAGSERASQALSAGSRLKEGSHINRSLLTLGTVIRKLSKGRTGHIPYRDSKLTRILQSSLGGNARTAVICTMSPARSYVEQSRNTLLFASCAKEVTTNARVNVVVSDKALVKHLQRELSRLENELRNASPVSRAEPTDLLKEKEYKIEELERHVRELTLQLDLALSQIHNLKQAVEDKSPTILEGEHSSYPRLLVRQSSESSLSDTTTVTEQSSIEDDLSENEAPQSPDRHSRLSYDENFSVTDSEENLPPDSPFEQMFIDTPSDSFSIRASEVQRDDCHRLPEKLGEQTTELSEVDPYSASEEIREQYCIPYEVDPHRVPEEDGEKTPDSLEIRLQQTSYERSEQSSCLTEIDQHQAIEGAGKRNPDSFEVVQCQIYGGSTEKTPEFDAIEPRQSLETRQTDEHFEDCKEVRCVETALSDNIRVNLRPDELEGETLLSTIPEGDRFRNDDLEKDNEPCDMTSSSLQDFKPSSSQQTEDMPQLENLKCVSSRTSHSDEVNSDPLESREQMTYEMKHENRCERDEFAVRLEDSKTKLSDADSDVSLDSGCNIERDETANSDIKVSNQRDSTCSFTSVAETKEITECQCIELPHCQDEDRSDEPEKSIKYMKDVGLNPQDDLGCTSPWSSDVKSLQKEIFVLWDACNVSLVHRTHFFLLFIKGDQADTIFMEVERRRLSFIKDAFSGSKSIVLDGRKVTPAKRKRSLHKERKMLARLMKKRLTFQERIEFYVMWGISLESKRRSSQLAQRLWIDTVDMDHIVKSVNIVAKLVRFSEPQVPKEIFGLNLMTNQGRRRSFRWT